METLRVVSFDIDGTLTLGHGWFYIATALGRVESFRRSAAAFRRHEIDEDEHLTNLLNIAAGFPAVRVVEALRKTPRIENIPEGLQKLKNAGIRPYLLTHNPSYVCKWYVEEFGFSGYKGAMQAVRKGTICRTSGHADKVEWMRQICSRENIDPSGMMHVGDGDSDASVFALVGGGVAVNSKSRAAIRTSGRSLNTTDMMDIVKAVLKLQS